MHRCEVCNSESVKIRGGAIRSLFLVECQNATCRATYRLRLNLRAAIESIPVRPHRTKSQKRFYPEGEFDEW